MIYNASNCAKIKKKGIKRYVRKRVVKKENVCKRVVAAIGWCPLFKGVR